MITKRACLVGCVAMMAGLIVVALSPVGAVAGSDDRGASGAPVVLVLEPTAMLGATAPSGWPATSPWPPNGTNASVDGLGATGWMVINEGDGRTHLDVFVRGARPNTLYTIWTVFKPLVWCADPSAGCPDAFAQGSTKPGFADFPAGALPFYAEAGVVAPTAAMPEAFTSGMGLDPGATFFTNANGDGEVHVKLDYDLLGTTYDDGPPVGNADVVAQCAVPGIPLTSTSSTCPATSIVLADGQTVTVVPRFTVTSSWLRKYIVQVDPADRAAQCANYDPANPTSVFWQCIDPATVDPKTGTGLPRVWRYPVDHFRLAAHPDQLTHGFIGGSPYEHTIDMVGRRCRVEPPLAGEPACAY